tara:strand:+ start:2854 stop:3828 length:975 start_codon:yes stop_codon:yes gene_type:complete
MNWYKQSQSNLWDMTEKEYAGPWQDNFGDDDDAWSEWRKKRKEWTQQTQRAVSRGDIDSQTAMDRGLLLTGNDKNVQPLPPKLYHVTTARDDVLSGGVKTRDELSQSMGLGLGGGTSDTISFTDDIEVARAIKNSILDGMKVARSETTIERMIEMAATGEGADRPWLKDIYHYYNRRNPEEMPPNVKAIIEGYDYTESFVFPSTVEEQNEKDEWDWEPYGEKWPHGNDSRESYTAFRRRLTPEEQTDRNFDFYKTWITFREHAGGPMNPLFFLSDAVGLSKVDPEQVAIIEFASKPNGMGYQVAALGEWRTWDGSVTDPIGIVE